MLINLVPEFLALINAPDSEAAYRSFHAAHRPLLDAYWRNYVLDPDSPPSVEVIQAALRADRRDLYALLDSIDLERVADEAIARAVDVLGIEQPTDVVLMVGMGAANAGELVIDGAMAKPMGRNRVLLSRPVPAANTAVPPPARMVTAAN